VRQGREKLSGLVRRQGDELAALNFWQPLFEHVGGIARDQLLLHRSSESGP
jgi:hypothetical protein